MIQAVKTQTVLSQKELFEKAFIQINKDVTTDDRKNCAAKLGLAKVTIDRYVNGHIYDNSTAFKILDYLKKNINRRNKALNNAIS